MSLARTKTPAARPGKERTAHEASTPPHALKNSMFNLNILENSNKFYSPKLCTYFILFFKQVFLLKELPFQYFYHHYFLQSFLFIYMDRVLSGLHTANLSWQTRVGKPKLVCVNGTKTGGKHVCKLLASNRIVFADCFYVVHTHQLEFANFSLPCEGHLKF